MNALEYAKERKQGSSITHWKDATAPRVPIIEHADVRRMLLDMKSRVEGIRALAMKLAHTRTGPRCCAGKDEAKAAYHQGQVDLLVPLVKAYGSDQGFRVCETAIQTYGGAGYTRDYPVEQYCRDAKIFSIYEGTNHIQAMDLVGRKLGQAGGAQPPGVPRRRCEVRRRARGHADARRRRSRSSARRRRRSPARRCALMWFQSGELALVPLSANRFLEMMSELDGGWLLLEGAVIADAAKEKVDAAAPGQRVLHRQGRRGDLLRAQHLAGRRAQGAKLLADEDKSPHRDPRRRLRDGLTSATNRSRFSDRSQARAERVFNIVGRVRGDSLQTFLGCPLD